jgi:hypothetical protein
MREPLVRETNSSQTGANHYHHHSGSQPERRGTELRRSHHPSHHAESRWHGDRPSGFRDCELQPELTREKRPACTCVIGAARVWTDRRVLPAGSTRLEIAFVTSDGAAIVSRRFRRRAGTAQPSPARTRPAIPGSFSAVASTSKPMQETSTKRRRPYLAEVHFMLKGHRHGFEWWLNADQRSVYQERRWSHDEAHGIERKWDAEGRLRPGFPKFYVGGRRITRTVYERERNGDPSLPPYRVEDDQPQRKFPPSIARRLAR